ncbi:MAG: SLC13 family permease, partial [Microvirga sp.]
MMLDQALAFAILAVTMALFVWGRFRYDLVAVLALLAAVFTGIVPSSQAFSGFSDDIVIIVASALMVSAAVERSGIMEAGLKAISSHVTSTQGQIALLVTAVTVLSAFVKNIGALAMMIPVALQLARRSNTPPSYVLMPMAFGSLLGGLTTLIGTSPNIIVSRVRGEITGQPFGMFDFAPVGLGLAAAGVVFLSLAYRLLPSGRKASASIDDALAIPDYMTEARVTAGSAIRGQTVGKAVELWDGEVTVTGIVRNRTDWHAPEPDALLHEDDIVLLEGEPQALERAVARARLELEGEDRPTVAKRLRHETAGLEAVIGPTSILIGQTARRVHLYERFTINLLAVSRSGQRFSERLRDIRLQAGDVLVLKGDPTRVPDRLRELGCLPLAEREIRLGNVRKRLIPVVVLGGAMGLTALGVVPVALGFFAAAVLMILLRALSLRQAYGAIQAPILVMLAALIPVSEAIRTTGGADLVARVLSDVAASLPASGALALMMIAAMAITPFLNNAATVLVMAPIAVSFAQQLGYRPDAFLMAVATGAACDFLTPIGHQCNTLVMGPGGYRFGDYWRLGLPLSGLVLGLGVPLILAV